MIVRDAIGNGLSEGDTISFALGLGNIVVGQVAKVSSIIENNDPNAQQSVHVLFTLPMVVSPNGVVPGIVKTAKAGE